MPAQRQPSPSESPTNSVSGHAVRKKPRIGPNGEVFLSTPSPGGQQANGFVSNTQVASGTPVAQATTPTLSARPTRMDGGPEDQHSLFAPAPRPVRRDGGPVTMDGPVVRRVDEPVQARRPVQMDGGPTAQDPNALAQPEVLLAQERRDLVARLLNKGFSPEATKNLVAAWQQQMELASGSVPETLGQPEPAPVPFSSHG